MGWARVKLASPGSAVRHVSAVCAYVREDNTRALASGLSHLYTHNHTLTFSVHQHTCCEIFDAIKHIKIEEEKLWHKTM